MSEPVTKAEIDQAAAVWAGLKSGGAPWFLTGESPQRTELVAGLRGLADFLETRLDVPVDSDHAGATILVYADGNLEEKRAQVEYAARLMKAEIEDRTRSGGHYYARRSFGPVTYEMVGVNARQPETAFAPGQEVQLTLDAQKLAAKAGLATAGYVTACEEDPSGAGQDSYTVHFPGRAGGQSGWQPTSLSPARFEPVELGSGRTVTSMKAAEKLLIEVTTEIRDAKTGRQPGDVALQADQAALVQGLAGACGLAPAELLEQIEPEVGEKIRSRVTAHSLEALPTAPELAASDRHTVAAALKDVPAQDDDQQPSREPAITRARGKER